MIWRLLEIKTVKPRVLQNVINFLEKQEEGSWEEAIIMLENLLSQDDFQYGEEYSENFGLSLEQMKKEKWNLKAFCLSL